MRVRLRLAKGEEARFLSHLELSRAVERAVRRAGLPVALSEGFHPLPKISFASALAVGVTSEGEYVDLILRERMAAEEVRERLNRALPSGLRVLVAREVPLRLPALMAVVGRAEYLVRLLPPPAVRSEQAVQDLLALLEREKIIVERQGKKGARLIDVRPFLQGLRVLSPEGRGLKGGGPGEEIQVWMAVKAGPEGSGRPEEILTGLPWTPVRLRVHRLGLYPEGQGGGEASDYFI